MKYIYSTSQMSKLSLTLRTFSITGSVAGLFLTIIENEKAYNFGIRQKWISKNDILTPNNMVNLKNILKYKNPIYYNLSSKD